MHTAVGAVGTCPRHCAPRGIRLTDAHLRVQLASFVLVRTSEFQEIRLMVSAETEEAFSHSSKCPRCSEMHSTPICRNHTDLENSCSQDLGGHAENESHACAEHRAWNLVPRDDGDVPKHCSTVIHSGRCQAVGLHDPFCLKRAPKFQSQVWEPGPLPPAVASWGHGRSWASAWVGHAVFTDGPGTPTAMQGSPPPWVLHGLLGAPAAASGRLYEEQVPSPTSQASLPSQKGLLQRESWGTSLRWAGPASLAPATHW